MNANLCGRNEVNLHDVIGVLRDTGSFKLRDSLRYLKEFGEARNQQLQIFDHVIPKFPVQKASSLLMRSEIKESPTTLPGLTAPNQPSNVGFAASTSKNVQRPPLIGQFPNATTTTTTTTPDSQHLGIGGNKSSEEKRLHQTKEEILDIPENLPPFPDQHTYSFTGIYSDIKPKEQKSTQLKKTQEKRKLEASLTRLHALALQYGTENQISAGAATDNSVDGDEIRGHKEEGDAVINPFAVVEGGALIGKDKVVEIFVSTSSTAGGGKDQGTTTDHHQPLAEDNEAMLVTTAVGRNSDFLDDRKRKRNVDASLTTVKEGKRQKVEEILISSISESTTNVPM